MKFESLQNITLPKIGFGTWRIGGGSHADPKKDVSSLAALRTALEVGYTHFDTAEMYANGHSEELLGQAIIDAQITRTDLFITTKVMPAHLHYEDVLKSCQNSLRRLRMDYVDLYLIHWPGTGTKYEETFRALNKLVRDGKVKHLGVSSFNLKLLKQSQSLSETPILTNQAPYSFSDRSYVLNGVLEYCQQNEIFLTAYSPVDEGNLRANKTLEAVARSRGLSTYQVALAWIISKPTIITIPMSADPAHIRENFKAADIELSADEMNLLDGV